MYIDTCKTKGKYIRCLLREGYRENGKVKHRTIANLSDCSKEEIEAIRMALRHKDDLTALISVAEEVSIRQGLSVGSAWLVYDIARQLGITEALGSSRQGKLALWQVIARVIDQGSRLSAVRLATRHATCDIMGLGMFNEDDLYKNLDWLSEKQPRIENILFRILHPDNKPRLFLYDVTSSYLEGVCNDLAAFGYNRDGKKSKRQIVIGLLCNEAGKPLSIEVFAGNIQDQRTLASQIRKVAERFGGDSVTFVGDRGMIKSKGVEDLLDYGFHYITAITKPQIESLLNEGVIQLSLFDQELTEVETNNGIRYVLRRNPLRAKEVKLLRESKLESLRIKMRKKNQYLREHPRASVEVALREVQQQCEKLRLTGWVKVSASGGQIDLFIDEDALAETAKLDGCYVLKTDLTKKAANKKTVHDRYKDLALVERAFRTSKTVELEIRPVYVQRASRTRGHALVVMLAYKIVQELAERWHDLDLTVQEGINELTTLCAMEMLVKGEPRCNKIPEPRVSVKKLLNAAAVRLPQVLPCKGVRVATRKKLTGNRKPR
jgi:transposase